MFSKIYRRGKGSLESKIQVVPMIVLASPSDSMPMSQRPRLGDDDHSKGVFRIALEQNLNHATPGLLDEVEQIWLRCIVKRAKILFGTIPDGLAVGVRPSFVCHAFKESSCLGSSSIPSSISIYQFVISSLSARSWSHA